MASKLAEFESSGILRLIDALSILDKNNGIINHINTIPLASLAGSLIQYAKGAYDDDFARTIASEALDGNGIKVLSATRANEIGVLSIELTAPFKSETVTMRIPHGAYT